MIGRTIGNYQITSELAQGGMGAVYRARHLHLPREVVVKSILLGAFSPSAQVHLKARFRREAFIQSQLDHPNIVRVYEFFAGEDNYYLVMEYVQGMSLRELLARQGVPTPAQAVYLLKQALVTLDHAHNFGYLDESDNPHTGIIHRDIKPANLLLDTKGRLKITDFGIVKVLGEQTGMAMTQSGFHPGTVEYMSPEQLLGMEIDARSDLYSLGVTFYEMLTGRLPFERSATGSDWEIRKGHIERDPPSPLEFRPEIHPELAAIILRSLRKNPNERFQSAAEFLEAVRSYEQLHAVKEQTLQSPAIKSTQPQPMKPTLIDKTATLVAQPSSNQSRPSSLEDAVTLPLTASAASSASAQAMVPSAAPSQPAQSRRRWPLAVGGVGLLLAGTAAGAIFFSKQGDTNREPNLAASPEAASPAPTATARAVSKPRSTPAPADKPVFKQAQAFEEQERYDDAIRVYENYLARNPNAADADVVSSRLGELKELQASLLAAESAMNSRIYPVARKHYFRALELRPSSQRAKQGLAEADAKLAGRAMPAPGAQRFPRDPRELPRAGGEQRPQAQPGQQPRPFDQPPPPRFRRKAPKPTPTPPDSE
jgi:serine/threonine protein kinase